MDTPKAVFVCEDCGYTATHKRAFSNHTRWHRGLMDKASFRGMNKGEKNGMWKGEDAGKGSIHDWIKRIFPKAQACKDCGIKTEKLDLANISQKYYRDISDWEWLCRRCHMTKDGRIEKMKSRLVKWHETVKKAMAVYNSDTK